MDCGKSYLFKGLPTRVFDYVKYLNTSEATIIEKKDKITNVNLTSDEIKDTIIEGQCIGVHIKKQQTCVTCNHSLDTETDTELITCPHCSTTMLSSTCTTKVVCNITVKTLNGVDSTSHEELQKRRVTKTHASFRPNEDDSGRILSSSLPVSA